MLIATYCTDAMWIEVNIIRKNVMTSHQTLRRKPVLYICDIAAKPLLAYIQRFYSKIQIKVILGNNDVIRLYTIIYANYTSTHIQSIHSSIFTHFDQPYETTVRSDSMRIIICLCVRLTSLICIILDV